MIWNINKISPKKKTKEDAKKKRKTYKNKVKSFPIYVSLPYLVGCMYPFVILLLRIRDFLMQNTFY